jgi:hypothetical protein
MQRVRYRTAERGKDVHHAQSVGAEADSEQLISLSLWAWHGPASLKADLRSEHNHGRPDV